MQNIIIGNLQKSFWHVRFNSKVDPTVEVNTFNSFIYGIKKAVHYRHPGLQNWILSFSVLRLALEAGLKSQPQIKVGN